MSSVTSLYIPHVFGNISKQRISDVFDTLEIGMTSSIDFVAKMSHSGVAYNSVYIHFSEWYDTIAARNFHSKVIDPNKEARLSYEHPWYWIVLENKAQKFVPGERKPCIVIDTPIKAPVAPVAPTAPVKAKVIIAPMTIAPAITPRNLFDADEEIMAEMDEMEEEIQKEEDQKFASYVQFIEDENNALIEENMRLRDENARLQQTCLYIQQEWNAENIKSQALASVIQMVNKEKVKQI